MANKTTLGPPTWPAAHSAKDKAVQAQDGRTGETIPDDDDLDERFREAIQRGDMNGDVVFLDEQGSEIKNALSNKTIFDL